MLKRKKLLALTLTALVSMGVLAGCGQKNQEAKAEETGSGEKVVNVYSSRHYDIDKQLFKDFESDTGIKVNLVDGKSDELIERMAREGDNTSADVFLTVGAENIAQLNEKDLIKDISSEKINENIPSEYRGSYYIAKMISSSDAEEAKVGKEIGVLFPENTHLNLSFGAVTKNAKNEENAVALLEYLTEEKAQKAYVDENGEFALNTKVGKSELQKSWGEFTVQNLNYEILGESKQEATLIFDQVGWK